MTSPSNELCIWLQVCAGTPATQAYQVQLSAIPEVVLQTRPHPSFHSSSLPSTSLQGSPSTFESKESKPRYTL